MPAARRLVQQLRFSEAHSTGLMLGSMQERNMMHQRTSIGKNPQQQSAGIAGAVPSSCMRSATVILSWWPMSVNSSHRGGHIGCGQSATCEIGKPPGHFSTLDNIAARCALTFVACSVQSPNMATMAAMYALCSDGTMTRRRVFQIAPSAAGQPGRHPWDAFSMRRHKVWVCRVVPSAELWHDSRLSLPPRLLLLLLLLLRGSAQSQTMLQ